MEASKWYKVDSRRLTFAEYWRFADGNVLGFLIFAVIKILRVPIDFKSAVKRVERLNRLGPVDLTETARDELNPFLGSCHDLGVAFHFYYSIEMLSANDSAAAALLSSDGTFVPQLLYAKAKEEATVSFVCATKLSDGRLLVTSNQAKKFDVAPRTLAESLPNSLPKTIVHRHKERMRELKGAQPHVVTPEALEAFIVELTNRDLDDKIARGLYVPMTEAEVGALRAKVVRV